MGIATTGNEMRANDFLDKLINTPFGVMTRRDFYTKFGIGKSKQTCKHAARKINGCYAELKNPKITYYTVTLSKDGTKEYWKIPKVVFDYIIFAEIN